MAGLRDQLAGNPFLTGEAGSDADPIATVIVPLYNAVEDAAACLASVARHTSCPFRLVLINDGSTDPRVSAMLADLFGIAAGLVVVDRPDNRGFVVTINEGLALTPDGHVVMLNSDTVVTRGWLEKLTAVVRSRPNVATVTPLTNNGTICSVPAPLVDNALPAGYDVDSFGALIEATSHRIFPDAPTGVGFCMLMTRGALDAVGPLDVVSFGLGYGEENDFSQRALASGFVNVIADDTFVYHKGGSSFADRTGDLLARNLAIVAVKHPRYAADVEAFCRRHPLRDFHADLERAIAARNATAKADLRILHILHQGGGTEKHARELAEIDAPEIASYVLTSDGRDLRVDEYRLGRRQRSLLFPLRAEIGHEGPRDDAGYREALTTICRSVDINLIHVHHLMANALDIAEVAREGQMPFVMTLHDYYMLCPSYTLLAPDGSFCGACIGREAGRTVDACMSAMGQSASFLSAYQGRTGAFLRRAARVFAPNQRVREIFAACFPEIANRITIIEHGHRRGPRPAPPALRYDGGSSLNVAVIGGLDRHKGSHVLRDILRANRNRKVVFHLYGTTSDPELRAQPGRTRTLDGSTFIYHGPYEASRIVQMLGNDGIHVGLHLSTWPETFSYTLSEFAHAGIPVIVGDLGAQGERVRRFQLGWTVPEIRDATSTLRILDEICQRPTVLAQAVDAMRSTDALTPIEATWQTYARIYGELGATASGERKAHVGEGASREYVAFLAERLAGPVTPPAGESRAAMAQVEADLVSARARLRSPRHRIAEKIGNAIQKVPVLWPLIARLTDAVLERENARKKRD